MAMRENRLKYYDQHPDEVEEWLNLPGATQTLRDCMRRYQKLTGLGPDKLVPKIFERVKDWCHPIYQDKINHELSANTLKDFVKKRPSDLQMPSRLFVHAFLWVVFPDYRELWGEFESIAEQSPSHKSNLPEDSSDSPPL